MLNLSDPSKQNGWRQSMIIPYSTDAPIYHAPIATIVFIVVNVIFFFAFCIGYEPDHDDFRLPRNLTPEEKLEVLEAAESEEFDPEKLAQLKRILEGGQEERTGFSPEMLILEFGKIRPWQWVTNMFMHADIMHLLGNMIFLWAFGLVVEGKLGSIFFALIYLGMGVAQSIFIQGIMIFQEEGGALGASGAIFALLALVVIFAPANSFECFIMFGFRVFTFEMPILLFGFFYLAMNGVFFFIGGMQMSSEALHLAGFMVGVPVGFLLLLRGWVDCEGYDIISHLHGEQGRKSKLVQKLEKKQEAEGRAELEQKAQAVRANLGDQIDQAIAEGNFELAVSLQHKLNHNLHGMQWKQSQLLAVIQGLLKQKNYMLVLPLLEQHIEMYDPHRFQLQVTMIKLWLQMQRPRHALRYMQGLNPALLPADQNEQLAKLAAYAKKQIAQGVVEYQ